jgi:hypothetical protein
MLFGRKNNKRRKKGKTKEKRETEVKRGKMQLRIKI